MKKKVITGIVVVVLILAVLLLYLQRTYNLRDLIYLHQNISLMEDKAKGEGIYVVQNEKNVSMWNMDLQNVIEKKIEKSARKSTFETPFLVYNPYGTNTCSLNIYYDTKEATSMEYTVTVDDASIGAFTREAYNGGENNLATKHAYQIIGIMPNHLNTVTIRQLDKDKKPIAEHSFQIRMGGLVAKEDPKMTITDGTSKTPLANGLYAILGHDKKFNANVFLFDNDGNIRSEFPLKGYRTDRIEFIGDNMLYSYDFSKFVMVNRLGKIIKKYNMNGFKQHHDFIYNKERNSILVLVNELNTDTIEDVIAEVNLDTGETKKLVDFRDIMPAAKEAAVRPEVNTYGGTELDWIHFNSIDIMNDKDIVLSARELSTIICVTDTYTNPTIKYLIADESVWTGTEYENLMLNKVGDFVSQAGQHAVIYLKDETLPDNQYYLYMYNNNYKGARTRPNFNWKNYVGVGTLEKGTHSLYYQYLVDETARTYELVNSFKVPYSSIVSNAQQYKGNYVTSSGKSNCYNEYDAKGKLIRQFDYTSEKYAYRVIKYSFENFWFAK